MTLEQLIVIIKAETAGLEKGIDKVKGQLSSLEKAANRVSGNISNAFSKASSGMNKAFKALSLGAIIGGLTAFGKKALDSASDLQEWQNVVDVAFGSASKDADTFAKMAVNRFGLSEVAAKKLTGTFMAMANGIGLSQEAGAKMSIQMSGLAADMASFFNSDYETTMNALEGIFTGQTRALKQFGVVMTEANLEAFRMSRGMQTAYSDMNEAQRAALRYNYVLAATANSQNDFARTSMSWANQMRQLAMNWQSLTTTVGNSLIQLLTPVVAILNKILSAAIAVVNAIAKIFGGQGISKVGSSIGDAGAAAGGLADNIGNVGDGLGNANKAAKKFKATIAGFDELEVLNAQPTSGSGGGGGSGAGGGGGSPGAEDIGSYFDLYDEEGILNKFEDFFQKIKDMMDADNWEGVGAEVGKGLNYIFKAVDDWITNTFEPFGILWAGRIARVLNGLVDTVDWDLIGKTLADGLNSYIHIANEFYENFNALNFAVGIASAINSWFRNVDWEGIGQYLANKLNFLGDMLYGFATTLDWETMKNSIQTALDAAFANLDVEKIKTSIGMLVNDAVEFLSNIDWYQIGYTVGEMLSEVDWLGILIDVKDNVIWPAVKGFFDGIMSDGQNNLLGWLGKIRSFFSTEYGPAIGLAMALFIGPALKILSAAYTPAMIGWFTEAAQNARANHTTFLGSVFSSLGFSVKKFAKGLSNLFQPIKDFFVYTLPSMFSGGETVGEGLKLFFGDMGTAISSVNPIVWAAVAAIASLTASYGGIGGTLKRIGKVFSDTAKHVKEFADKIDFSGKLQKLKDGFSAVADALARFYPIWETLFTAITAVATTVINVVIAAFGGLAEVIGGALEIIGNAAALIIDLVTGNFEQLKSDIEGIWQGIKDVFSGAIDFIVDIIRGFVDGIINFFKDMKYNLIGDPIVIDMWEGIKKVFKDAIEAVLKFVKDLVEKVIKFFKDLWDKAKEIFNSLKQFLVDTWNNIKTTATNVWNSIKEWLSQTWEAIKLKASEVWTSIQTTTTAIWTAIKEFLAGLWEGIKTTISTAIENVKTTVSNAWNSISTTSSEIWNGIKNTVSSVWDGIKSKAESVTNSIKNFFSTAYSSIQNTWNSFGSWFSGIFSGLDSTVRSAMNGVIGAMNSISVTVPSWVPKIGGKTFGFSIPYLARGGIIDSPTVAMMGEYAGASHNPEIVAPQALLQSIIKEENGEMVSALYQIAKQIITAIDDVDLTVAIGDDAIGNAANRANNSYKKRTGKPLFSM